jgi:hypothetical protein
MFAPKPQAVVLHALFGLVFAGLSLAAPAAAPSVPYVPTPPEVVERMLEMAKVGPADYLIDLGSGDGRIVVTAAKKLGTRGIGVDINPERIREANENARKAGVTDRVSFQQRDLMETDLADATVITLYLLPRVNLQLRPKLLELKPGTRIVSHDFSMDDWKADDVVDMNVPAKYGSEPGQSTVYFWVVPAKVAGTWQWELTVGGKPQKYEAALNQEFQAVSGTVASGGRSVKLGKAALRGDEVSMTFVATVNGEPLMHELSGRVTANAIIGSVRVSGARVQGQYELNATRSAQPPVAAGGR